MNRWQFRRTRPFWLTLAAAAIWFAMFSPADGTDGPPLGEAVFTIGSIAPAKGDKPAGEPKKPNAVVPPEPEKPKAPLPLSDRIVEYHIGVTLDPESKTLHGTQTVTWRNPGKNAVQELYFHLYPNAFESDRTTFLRESGGKHREDRRTEIGVGSMTVTSIRTSEGLDLIHRMAFVQPDDGNKHDRTLMHLRLPQPVPPGEKTTLLMSFEVKLPEVFARMGYKGDFVMAGQWFPKLAVYEPAHVRGRPAEGWNAHQYHGNSEFYADFGIYNVKITVPQNYIVAATGFPPRPAVTDRKSGMKTYHFYADDVHDFAWAASPHFVYAEEPFSSPNVPGVKIKLYLDPLHLELKDRYLYAAKKALDQFSAWYGPYPYSTLSIVVPPPGAGGAGGMEYPTLITAWAADSVKKGLDLERVVVHEIAHQFWYGIVANNEFEEAWLDEGFASYAEDKLMAKEFGAVDHWPVEAIYMTDPASLTRFSWNFKNHDHYADNVYIRGKLVLKAIEREIGEAQMRRVMRTYFSKWKFRHPSTRDFQQTLETVTRRSWDSFFDQFVYGDLMVDYRVEKIEETVVLNGNTPSYAYKVTVANRGGRYGPVVIRFQYEDGKALLKEWKGDEAETVIHLPAHTARLAWAAVDPDRAHVLEHKRINNFLKTDIDDRLEARWNLGVAKLIEAAVGIFVW